MLTFLVPPGIGDFSAMYAKLCRIPRQIGILASHDEPQRLSPFLDILPKIKNLGYGLFGTGGPLAFTLSPGTDLTSLPDGEYFLAVNEYLERGGKIADWIPGEVDYHFDMNTAGYRSFASSVLPKGVPVVGVYTSAYGNSRHWGFWVYEQWMEFLELIISALPPETVFAFTGAEYDLMISDALYNEFCRRWGNDKALWLVGQCHIGETAEIIKSLDYFFIFPSGLGFIADVVRTPHIMWFPEHLSKMRGTFTDPEQFESGRTIHSLFKTPSEAFAEFSKTGMKFFEESVSCKQSSRL